MINFQFSFSIQFSDPISIILPHSPSTQPLPAPHGIPWGWIRGHHGIVAARLWRPVATPRPAQRTSAAARRGVRAAHRGRWRGTAENLAEMGSGDGSKHVKTLVPLFCSHQVIAGLKWM